MYSLDMVRSPKVSKVNEQHEVPNVVSKEEEQEEQFNSASEEQNDLPPTLTINASSLDDFLGQSFVEIRSINQGFLKISVINKFHCE